MAQYPFGVNEIKQVFQCAPMYILVQTLCAHLPGFIQATNNITMIFLPPIRSTQTTMACHAGQPPLIPSLLQFLAAPTC